MLTVRPRGNAGKTPGMMRLARVENPQGPNEGDRSCVPEVGMGHAIEMGECPATDP